MPTKGRRAITGFVILCMFLLASAFAAQPAQAQKFEVLHTFHKGKGPQNPTGQLVLDKEGNCTVSLKATPTVLCSR
jgi:hypothetical protein